MSTSTTVFLAFGVTLSAAEAEGLEPRPADPVVCDPCSHPDDEAAPRHVYYVATSARPVLETRNGPEYPAAVLDLDALRAECRRFEDEWRGALREYATVVLGNSEQGDHVRSTVSNRAGWMLVVSDG